MRSEETPPTPWLPILLSSSYWIPSQNKTKSHFWILKNTLHATHLKFPDKMCKYKMDPASIVEDTERTRFCPQTDRQTDRQTEGQTDKVKLAYPLQIRWAGGMIMMIMMIVIMIMLTTTTTDGDDNNDNDNNGYNDNNNNNNNNDDINNNNFVR